MPSARPWRACRGAKASWRRRGTRRTAPGPSPPGAPPPPSASSRPSRRPIRPRHLLPPSSPGTEPTLAGSPRRPRKRRLYVSSLSLSFSLFFFPWRGVWLVALLRWGRCRYITVRVGPEPWWGPHGGGRRGGKARDGRRGSHRTWGYGLVG
jgi:hypothetical protein